MSIVGVLSSSLLHLSSPTVTSPQQSFQKEFQKLGKDLQSGNLSAAQQDFSKVQQDVRSQSAQVHHHHHHSSGTEGSSSSQPSTLAQEFAQLSQDLQSGNLSAAQQAYNTVQQSFQASGASNAFASATTLSSVA